MLKVVLSVEPIRFPLTGIGRYTYELAKALSQHSGIGELRLFGSRSFVDQLPDATAGSGSLQLKSLVQGNPLASELYRRVMPLLKAHALRKCSDAIYHGPNFYLPPFPGRRVTTFHDLSPFKWPDCAPAGRVRFMQKELKVALRRADAFITDSYFTQRELAEYFDIEIDRIHTVPLATSSDFRPRNAGETAKVLARYSLQHGSYALYVGTIEPRKNLLTLLQAYAQLSPAARLKWPLITVGYRGWKSDEIHLAMQQGQREGWLRYLDYVPTDDLPALFCGARLFCFPSYYEGFGLPVLEAMTSGTPVVCSNSSSLREVAGDACATTAPDDVEGFRNLIARGLEDEAWRESAIHKGLEHSRSFSWERCAAETMQVYEKVMATR